MNNPNINEKRVELISNLWNILSSELVDFLEDVEHECGYQDFQKLPHNDPYRPFIQSPQFRLHFTNWLATELQLRGLPQQLLLSSTFSHTSDDENNLIFTFTTSLPGLINDISINLIAKGLEKIYEYPVKVIFEEEYNEN